MMWPCIKLEPWGEIVLKDIRVSAGHIASPIPQPWSTSFKNSSPFLSQSFLLLLEDSLTSLVCLGISSYSFMANFLKGTL